METDSVPGHPCLFVGSCRGFIALYQYPHFFILWNPLTGSHKRISCHHIPKFSTLARRCFSHFRSDFLFGFGYDISKDDYFVLLGWFDHTVVEDGERFEFFSLRSNSWQSLDDAVVNAIPHQLRRREQWSPSMFFNGAIHWLHHGFDGKATIFVLDTRKRWSFWEIPVPQRAGVHYPCYQTVLGGCLAVYYDTDDDDSGGKLLMRVAPSCVGIGYGSDFTVYTESLITLPDDSDSRKKQGSSCSGRMKVIQDQERINLDT
ncbi:hypothetical protein PIB30_001471 [Stylosanthes scabra]|uniref:F-box associated beta-propeller type 1 domain-containing protein n=1 Tax=Stylosanthes scabra TaxID=79078 RepID=A0ABU6Q3T8_9FABA|nr:hypothetical protein [Stylosanthes scabra]